jgi:hypothetical protein
MRDSMHYKKLHKKKLNKHNSSQRELAKIISYVNVFLEHDK